MRNDAYPVWVNTATALPKWH